MRKPASPRAAVFQRVSVTTGPLHGEGAWCRPGAEKGLIPTLGDAALAVEVVACTTVSVAICAASDHLVFMSAVVALAVVGRCAAWARLPRAQRWGSLRAELGFLAICTVLGAANDWMSVVYRRVYDYTVPVELPAMSTIPLWMLFYWGLILRSLATLCRWGRLEPPARVRNDVHLGGRVITSPRLKIAVLRALVMATRQAIYRTFLDPWLSWIPFALALLIHAALFRPGPYERRLGLVILVLGPAIELAYIHVGALHRYHLGWLGGVPLWIALWWVLGIWVWSDLAPRMQRHLQDPHASSPTGGPTARSR